MLKNMSLKNKLAISASFAIIVSSVTVSVLSLQSSLDRLKLLVDERVNSSMTSYNQYVSDWLASKENALMSLPQGVEEDNLVVHLQQLKNSAGFDNVFAAFDDGTQQNANGVVLPAGNDDPRQWGWYKNAAKDPSDVFIDNPTVAAATGANVVSLGKAQSLFNRQFILGADVEITDILTTMEQVILPGEGFMFIANESGYIFSHPDTSLLNKPVETLGINRTQIREVIGATSNNLVDIDGEEVEMFALPIENTALVTVVAINYRSLVAPIYNQLYKQLGVTVLLVIVCIVLFNVLCNILFRPLQNVAAALSQIANGSGDLSKRIDIDANDEVGHLANDFNRFVAKLHELILHIQTQAQGLTAQSNSSEDRAELSASKLAQQQHDISMVATSVTEMASATQAIAQNAEQAAKVATDSSKITKDGSTLVMTTRQAITHLAKELSSASNVVSELDKHAQEISVVIATIQGIAEQTNLLALNAAIEAARAGEQGRGFAVVADEVRVLSQRTHASTEEIKSTIETLQGITARAVGIMSSSSAQADKTVQHADNASEALIQINESVASITDMASEISTAAEQQTYVTEEITQNITAIKDVTDELAVGADESLKQATELKAEAQSLSSKVSSFTL